MLASTSSTKPEARLRQQVRAWFIAPSRRRRHLASPAQPARRHRDPSIGTFSEASRALGRPRTTWPIGVPRGARRPASTCSPGSRHPAELADRRPGGADEVDVAVDSRRPAYTGCAIRHAGARVGRSPPNPLARGRVGPADHRRGDLPVGLIVDAFGVGGPPLVALVTVLQSLPSVVLAPAFMAAAARVRRPQLLAGGADRALRHGCRCRHPARDERAGGRRPRPGRDRRPRSTVLRPIRGTLVPMIARSPDELVAANVGITTGMSAASLLGPAVAAVILVAGSVEATFLLASALFVVRWQRRAACETSRTPRNHVRWHVPASPA